MTCQGDQLLESHYQPSLMFCSYLTSYITDPFINLSNGLFDNSVENKSRCMPTPILEAGDTAVSKADMVPALRSNQTSRRFPLHCLLSAFLQKEKADVYNLPYLFEVL